jgi:hypothetical protein
MVLLRLERKMLVWPSFHGVCSPIHAAHSAHDDANGISCSIMQCKNFATHLSVCIMPSFNRHDVIQRQGPTGSCPAGFLVRASACARAVKD